MRILCLLAGLVACSVQAQTYPAEARQRWSQPVVVENRAGAGGSLAASAVKGAPADGYMLLVHPHKDFIAVAHMGSQPQVLVVNPKSGIGSGAHFNAEMFRIAAGIEVLHVPYKGGVDAINDTAAGRLTFTFNTLTLALRPAHELAARRTDARRERAAGLRIHLLERPVGTGRHAGARSPRRLRAEIDNAERIARISGIRAQ